MKNGKIDILSFHRNSGEPKSGINILIYDENRMTVVEIEMTYEEFGKALSGRGNINMRYKKFSGFND